MSPTIARDAPAVVPPPEFGPLPGPSPVSSFMDMFNAHMDDAVVGLMDPGMLPFVHNQLCAPPS